MTIIAVVIAAIGAVASAIAARAGLSAVAEAKKTVVLGKESLEISRRALAESAGYAEKEWRDRQRVALVHVAEAVANLQHMARRCTEGHASESLLIVARQQLRAARLGVDQPLKNCREMEQVPGAEAVIGYFNRAMDDIEGALRALEAADES